MAQGSTTMHAHDSAQGGRFSLLRKGSWGLADQMLISLTNFVTMVLLARGLGPAGFGAFVLIYTVLQFAGSLQGALVIQPHSVLGATRQGINYRCYTTSTAVSQVLFFALVSLLVLIAGVTAWAFEWSVAQLLIALAPAIVARQLQEFARRVLYTELRWRSAFLNDVVCYGGLAVVLALIWWREQLSGPLALYAIAVTSAVAAAFGFWQLRGSLARQFDWGVLRENWTYGKWLAGAELGYWLSSQLYLYLTGILLGAAAAGVLKAAYVIFGPTRIVSFFLRTVLPTWFARTLASAGPRGMHQQLKTVYLAAAPLLGGYCLLVALFAGPLVRWIYGPSYADHWQVVALYAAFAMTAFMASIVSAALRARRRTRYIFATQMGASLTLPLGWLCIKWLGVEGAVVGMILTSLLINLMFWRAYLRDLKATDSADDTSIDDAEKAGINSGDADDDVAQAVEAASLQLEESARA